MNIFQKFMAKKFDRQYVMAQHGHDGVRLKHAQKLGARWYISTSHQNWVQLHPDGGLSGDTIWEHWYPLTDGIETWACLMRDVPGYSDKTPDPGPLTTDTQAGQSMDLRHMQAQRQMRSGVGLLQVQTDKTLDISHQS